MKIDIEAELKRMKKRFASALGGGETDACYVEALTRLKQIGELTQEMWIGADGDRSGTLHEILRLCGVEKP